MRRLAPALGLLALVSCAPRPTRGPGGVLAGIDVLEADGFRELRGKKIGLITNRSGKDRAGRGTAEVLAAAPGVALVSLFSPEHGFLGTSEENKVSNATVTLERRDLPVFSLYAGGIQGMRPRQEDLIGLDALVFDIQDIGTRAYTYLATMGMGLEEAAKAGVEFVVLDRPNPINGVDVEGPILDDMNLRKVTATAYFPVPVRHGMTAGEIALLHNAEVKHPALTVVRMRGWTREMWYDQTGLPWTPPSPNMPDLDAATLYPGVSIFEAGNVSVGRGTPWPFRWVGAPWFDSEAVVRRLDAALLDGITFSAQEERPTKSVYMGQACPGVRLHITDRARLKPLAVFRALEAAIRLEHPREFSWRWDELKRMVGTEEFRRILERDGDPEKIQGLFDRGAEDFLRSRRPYLLYDER